MKKINFYGLMLLIITMSIVVYAEPRSFISRFGITWTFDSEYECGQFVNGDWWVVRPQGGTVNIISIDPSSVLEVDGRIRNGSMLNHIPASGTNYQGFDNAFREPGSNPYKTEENAAFNVSAENQLVITESASVISTISLPEPGANPVQIKKAVILTILDSIPPVDSFRPSYAGKDKSIMHTKRDINYSVLKKLLLVGDHIPSPEEYNSWFALPWLELGAQGVDSMKHPEDNMPWYGREIASRIGTAGLLLNSSLSASEKETLLIGFLQYGLDLAGLLKQDHTTGYFIADGGHGYGRKFPVLFAGVVFNDNNIMEIIAKSGHYINTGNYRPTNPPLDYIHFGEDHTAIYLSESYVKQNLFEYKADSVTPAEAEDENTIWKYYYDPGGVNTNLHRDNPDAYYNEADWLVENNSRYGIKGLPEYVKSADAGQLRWISRTFDQSYRSMGACLPGSVLAAHIMGIKELWNHDPLFDYTDRFIAWAFENFPAVDDNGLPADLRVFNSAFTCDMWYAYRASYGPIWPDRENNPKPEPEPEAGSETEQEVEEEAFNNIPDKTLLIISNNIIKSGGNSAVTINCDVKDAGTLTVTIYDSKGKEIITLWNKHEEAGTVPITWSGESSSNNKVGSGIYLVHMRVGSYKETKKIAVIK